ncbi:MAG: hypothetical protein IPJ01_11955 [Micavibrio sp.]|nr:hypothetical protein [Micavibrio sp.]
MYEVSGEIFFVGEKRPIRISEEKVKANSDDDAIEQIREKYWNKEGKKISSKTELMAYIYERLDVNDKYDNGGGVKIDKSLVPLVDEIQDLINSKPEYKYLDVDLSWSWQKIDGVNIQVRHIEIISDKDYYSYKKLNNIYLELNKKYSDSDLEIVMTSTYDDENDEDNEEKCGMAIVISHKINKEDNFATGGNIINLGGRRSHSYFRVRPRTIANRPENSNMPEAKIANVEWIMTEYPISFMEEKLGRKINSWKDDVITVEGMSFKKCYLRPYYELIK